MTYENPTGDELALAAENGKLVMNIMKAGAIASAAISMLGDANGVKAANIILVKACRDIAELVSPDGTSSAAGRARNGEDRE